MNEEVKEIAKELEDIGLSEKEAKVYLALLEVGQETVQNISKKANVNRATTYVILESLQKKGIVTTFEQAKKTFFIAEGPSALYNIIREQQEELEKKNNQLEEMMNQLMTVYNLHPDKPNVTFYEGKEGLKGFLKDRAMYYKNNQMKVFYPSKQIKNFFGNEINNLRENRISRSVKNKVIYYPSKDFDPSEMKLVDYKKMPDHLPFDSVIEIWQDKILIASLEGHISAVIIENKMIVNSIEAIFDLAFDSAEKV